MMILNENSTMQTKNVTIFTKLFTFKKWFTPSPIQFVTENWRYENCTSVLMNQ